MRKQEYVHLHALLVEVAKHERERGTLPPDALSAYEALDACPLTVNRSKETHHDAVMLLADALGTELERPPDSPVNVPRT